MVNSPMIKPDSLCATCAHMAVCSKRERLVQALYDVRDVTFFSETQAVLPKEALVEGDTGFVLCLEIDGGFTKCPDYEEGSDDSKGK